MSRADLPPLGVLAADEPFWRCPSGKIAGEDVAHLRNSTPIGSERVVGHGLAPPEPRSFGHVSRVPLPDRDLRDGGRALVPPKLVSR